jgi:hypothetical protein
VVRKSGVPVFVWVIIGIVVAIILLCGGIAVATGLFLNSAANAVKSGSGSILNTFGAAASAGLFDAALTTGNYEEAYSYLGGDLAKRYSAATLQQKWEALGGGANTIQSINSRFGAPRDVGNNQSSIDWIITPPNKPAVTVVLTLDEGTNDWKIIDAKPDLIPNP